MLSYKAANECIRDIEEKCDLLRFKVDGWCVWPILRHQVARAVADIPMATGSTLPTSRRAFRSLREVPKLLALQKAHYVIKTYSSARSEEQDGLCKDIYFDDLLLDFGDYHNFIKIESINNPSFLSKSKTALIESDLTSTPFEFMPSILARLRFPRYVLDIAERLSSYIQNELRLATFTPDTTSVWLLHFYWAKRFYAKLFNRIKPEYLLVADGGEYPIVAAAKEKGIATIEFQHGFIDRDTSWVYSWGPYALQYKPQMPIPDYLFLYGDHWKEELSSNGFWDENLRVVGSLRLDRYRKSNATQQRDVCTLVLTTQGIDQERLVDFIGKFLEIAQRKLKLHLYIKLHPVYETSKEPYARALRGYEDVEVLLGNEPPSTFELLSQAHFHLSISSTCHYESLGFGIPTVILPFSTHEKVLGLQAAGHAYLARTPQDLVDIIVKEQDREIPAHISEFYFKSGALENIKHELAALSG